MAVGRIAGVETVDVSLKEGVATIRFSPSNRVTLARVHDAVRKNGFRAREAEVRVSGTIGRRGDALLLVVPTTGEQFVLEAGADARDVIDTLFKRVGQPGVIVDGWVTPPANEKKGGGPSRLRVRALGVRLSAEDRLSAFGPRLSARPSPPRAESREPGAVLHSMTTGA